MAPTMWFESVEHRAHKKVRLQCSKPRFGSKVNDICGQTEEACRELANRIIRNGRDGTILTVVPLSGAELEKIRNGY